MCISLYTLALYYKLRSNAVKQVMCYFNDFVMNILLVTTGPMLNLLHIYMLVTQYHIFYIAMMETTAM
jgi:hypothetical protein